MLDPALSALIEEAGANASRRAAQFLALDADDEHGYQDWHRALIQFSRQGPAALVKTAVAVVAAHGEEQLRGGYRQPAGIPARCSDALGYAADDGEFPSTDAGVTGDDRSAYRDRDLNAPRAVLR